jgi:hypothetical protein
MRGAFWPVLNRVVVGAIWMGRAFSYQLLPSPATLDPGSADHFFRYSDVLGRTGGENHTRRNHWA